MSQTISRSVNQRAAVWRRAREQFGIERPVSGLTEKSLSAPRRSRRDSNTRGGEEMTVSIHDHRTEGAKRRQSMLERPAEPASEPQSEPELLRHWYSTLSELADSITEHGPRLSPECSELADAVLGTVQDLANAIKTHFEHNHSDEEPLEDEDAAEAKERLAVAKAWNAELNEALLLGAELTCLSAKTGDPEAIRARDEAHALINELIDMEL